MGRPGSGLRSQSEKPSPKEGDISTKSISTPATGAEKALSSTTKWRDLFSITDNNSNYSYKLNKISVEVPVQIKSKARIFNKNFDAFFSILNGRKGYISQPISKTQPL